MTLHITDDYLRAHDWEYVLDWKPEQREMFYGLIERDAREELERLHREWPQMDGYGSHPVDQRVRELEYLLGIRVKREAVVA